MQRPEAGIGLFYHRDSMGRSERSPSQYVIWTIKKAHELGVQFDGTPELIDQMIRMSKYHEKGIYLDYGVRGKNLDRSALNALVQEITRNTQVSHLFIPRRDRLSRPEDPLTAVGFETKIRRLGISIVYQNRILKPLRLMERADVLETTKALHDFDESGRFSQNLANTLIQAKLSAIELGASIGGPPPYGFERWLVGPDGLPVRKLSLGERTRMREHTVCWLPTNLSEIGIVLRIIELVRTHSCEDVAELLTIEGIDPPHASWNNPRKVWNRQTVRNIATNLIYTGVYEYCKTSGGQFLRMTAAGVRELEESDLDENHDPKRIVNPVEKRIRKNLNFEPKIDTRNSFRYGCLIERSARQAPPTWLEC
ncbi:MAG: recombinase family protein [Gemmatales bacterium]